MLFRSISGKMRTADLKEEPLPRDAAGWLCALRKGATTARYVADELDKVAERLEAVQVHLPADLRDRTICPKFSDRSGASRKRRHRSHRKRNRQQLAHTLAGWGDDNWHGLSSPRLAL